MGHVLVDPAVQLGDGNQAQLASPDQPDLRLHVALERVDRHAECLCGLFSG